MLAGFEEGGIVGAIGGAIKGFFNSLIFGPLDMIKDAIAWVLGIFGFDNAKKLLESFSLESMFSGLVDALFYIPKQIQKLLTSPIESLKNLGTFISDAFGSIGNLMGTLVDAFLYIPRKMLGLIQEYIFDPLTNVFKPVTDFFKSIKDNILGFFDKFAIPEMSFDTRIPGIGKINIGPFYPFKSSSAAAAPGGASTTIPAGKSDAGAGRGSSEFAKTDPRRLDLSSSVSNSVSKIKPEMSTPTAASAVYNKSAANAGAAIAPTAAPSNTVIAPTTNVNNNTTQVVRLPARNQDVSLQNYMNTRYGT